MKKQYKQLSLDIVKLPAAEIFCSGESYKVYEDDDGVINLEELFGS